jgi:hypothetical protein
MSSSSIPINIIKAKRIPNGKAFSSEVLAIKRCAGGTS